MSSSLTLAATILAFAFLLSSIFLNAPPISNLNSKLRDEQNTTHLHFYFHDITAGQNATVVRIAGPSDTASGSYGFGTTMMADDALTEGQDPSSRIVGRAQGIYGIAAQKDLALLMVMNFAFTDGPYNGSSVSLVGRNHVMDDEREMAIVGGTGRFRLARGYALAHTVWFDGDTGDATVEYNVYVTQ